jgi:hypothetical protein
VTRPFLALGAVCLATATACGAAPAVSGTASVGAAAAGRANAATAAAASDSTSGTLTSPVVARAAVAPAAAAAAVPTAVRSGRYAIGDSVMLGARANLTARSFRVNATVSRQFSSAKALVSAGARAGTLPRNVVVHLGTNGTISLSDCRTVVRTAGTARRVFFVTVKVPRSWMAANNRTLRSCDASFRAGRVVLIDWAAAAAGRSSWFAGDGYHLTSSGRSAYAALVDGVVDRNRL